MVIKNNELSFGGGGSLIEIRRVDIGTLHIGSEGWVDVSSYRPTVDGYTLIFAGVWTWWTGEIYGATGTGNYVWGKPNTMLTGVQMYYYFVPNAMFHSETVS